MAVIVYGLVVVGGTIMVALVYERVILPWRK